VLEADKLLDHLLKGHRAPGLTMGDRLKASEHRFSREAYNSAWNGHKVRNEIVHNAQYQLTDFMARAAIENFQKAIGELI
jgi:DNA-binding LacI/PurR family transcriptional regulator